MSKPLIVAIDSALSPESPCDNDGWKLHSFANNKFITDVDPTEYVKSRNRETGEVTAANGLLTRKLKTGLAFWLSYYEHSEGNWSLKGEGNNDRWDSTSLAGILVWERDATALGPKTLANRKADARAFLERYNKWANGYVYDWDIREPGSDLPIDEGSGYEWIGTDNMMAEIVRLVGDRPVIARGECKWMLSSSDYTKESLNVIDEAEALEELLAEKDG